jgi:hypothetical protein
VVRGPRSRFNLERSASRGPFVVKEAAERIRTADPFITSEVLYQLSYGGAGTSVGG